MLSFPPLILPHGQVQPYQVHVSTRARHLRIQISASAGVVVLSSHRGMLESVSNYPELICQRCSTV